MDVLPCIYSYDGFSSIMVTISTRPFFDSFVFEQSNNFFWDGLVDFDFPTKLKTYTKEADQYFRCEGLFAHLLFVLIKPNLV